MQGTDLIHKTQYCHQFNSSDLQSGPAPLPKRLIGKNKSQSKQHSEILSLLKIQKVGRAWWRVPIVPATQEAEAGELLESGRWRMQ